MEQSFEEAAVEKAFWQEKCEGTGVMGMYMDSIFVI